MSGVLSPQVRRRVGANPIGSVLEQYLQYLMARGYARRMWWVYLRVGEHFGLWLGRRKISPQTVAQFRQRHLPVCHCPGLHVHSVKYNRAGLRILLEMLGIQAPKPPLLPGYSGRLLEQYAQHLTAARGLTAASVKKHMTYTRNMLRDWQVRRASHLRGWTSRKISDYLTREHLGRNVLGCIRSFLRFLLQQGLITHDLALAVPSFVRWKLVALPPTLMPKEVERLLHAADSRTPVGLRDRAILLCMSELGMRAADVASLRLEDVDFTQHILHLRHCKQRQTAVLPLPPRLAQGLRAYLRHGRPSCSSTALFVRHHAPVGQALTPVAIGLVVHRLGQKAGLQHYVHGAHILRHSLARRLLAAGASLKQIADVLGHRSIDTTAIYAKVDMKALYAVALPWPGAREVQP